MKKLVYINAFKRPVKEKKPVRDEVRLNFRTVSCGPKYFKVVTLNEFISVGKFKP